MFVQFHNICVNSFLAQTLIKMSCRDNLDSKPTPSQFSEEFKAKVLKRGLELRNWSAVCKEFNIPRRTLSNWRHNYTNLLEQLAFEMGVNVYYNPQIDMEYQSNKPVSCITIFVSVIPIHLLHPVVKATVSGKLVSAPPPGSNLAPARILSLFKS